jgi:hypothetical protein
MVAITLPVVTYLSIRCSRPNRCDADVTFAGPDRMALAIPQARDVTYRWPCLKGHRTSSDPSLFTVTEQLVIEVPSGVLLWWTCYLG